ncbi:MAG: hypothetical protein ASARMPREDX12_007829 [Alectoria sarmentosa]|nr:MAG: hypothetical protein ASARMPREDX12_007829 [Alectoria sarmentosa]
MDRYALEDGNENAGDGEADDEVVAPEEDAAELDDGEDAVLEEDAAVSCHGERVEEFETVEDLEPAEQPLWAQDFKMSPEAIMHYEVVNVGTPREKLRICNYDSQIIPLFTESVLSFTSAKRSERRRHPTQKPAFDMYLDSKRKITATVGRISSGIEAPITCPPRLCSSSLDDRVTGSSDMFNNT